ncbi:MAG: hypothetical protein DKINENOH_03046 [bacterium]|nr:hypothetical protein [bacterium]
MLNNQTKDTNNKSEAAEKSSVAAPTISLPKGGGAIRGIGEKFAANPVTGTGSMTVPIATSPGRSGFGPQLALSYDSGAGNGPFGFGWNLSLPSITRKTDKGLPQYRDAEESDVFILSGAEDLVPEFEKDQNGKLIIENGKHKVHDKPRTVDNVKYNVRRYRPRIEGLFARIERWTNVETGVIHWRSISKDNITTFYGKDNNSRIFDPADPDPEHPTRIFSWLICQSYDDKGNAIIYEYVKENDKGVDRTQANERNRVRTANRYLKRIKYGNRVPNRNLTSWQAIDPTELPNDTWMFEVVFDYDEGHYTEDDPDADGRVFSQAKVEPPAGSYWPVRQDPFSSYRAGFEVRTYRLCQRVLMFHHFPNEAEVKANCLVRSTDFTYTHEQDPNSARNPVYTFLHEVTQSGYKRDGNGYLKRNLPPVRFEYTLPIVQDVVEEVDPESLENLPIGLDGAAYQWTDLHGEGIPGILTEQAGAWFYKRNLSPINEKRDNGTAHVDAKFAPIELVATKPNLALSGGAQFMDLAGDGQPDLVVLDDPMPGLYEHDEDESWQTFRPFTSRLNRDTRDPNLKFVDLDGDGHADVLITEGDAFVWHPSLAEAGFGPARRVAQALDEEKGPRLVFADGTQSIYLADLSGDGLTDLVRLRNGEVCYWPNLGYGRFGAKVTMDHAPQFDHPDQFDHKRIRLADIDGTGTTDIIYLHRDGVRLYFNQSGNSWSALNVLNVFPRVDELAAITPVDLLGNGTACLVWSSPLPGDARRPMRYVNLMGEHKPHLLVKTVNNLGAETHVQYAPSTKFYLHDKQAGKPWITRLPFPVHVVERVETFDHISRTRFVTRYAYHHGYFDGEEREFRGFGMVEQFDTEEFAALKASGTFSKATNIDAASHVPPVYTKTWFHTGVYLDREHISRQFENEYYREPELSDQDFQALLLPDTTLPGGLTLEEEREACRALKGMMLRQEVYADDARPGSDVAIIERAQIPYTIVEQDFTMRALQPRAGNRHAIFFTHPREAITFHYERKLVPILNGKVVDEATAAADRKTKWQLDPRVQHALTLEVDDFGNVLKEAAVGYGRRFDALEVTLEPEDREKQRLIHITCTENKFTKALVEDADVYRTPLPAETRTYELRQPEQEKSVNGVTELFQFEEMVGHVKQAGDGQHDVAYEDMELNQAKQAAKNDADEGEKYFRRLIEHVRTLYRKDDLTALLPLGEIEPLALPGESYKLAFTPALLALVFQRNGQPLLPIPADVLGGQGADRGGYVPSQNLKAVGLFPNSDPNDHWWIPSGRVFLSEDKTHDAGQELAYARKHFFLPRRYRDPFGQTTTVTHDDYDLLMVETRDALGNRVTVGERDANDNLTAQANDYRVLQPRLITDPNRNRTKVVFDVLGMVVGTAVMGKPEETKGDLLDNTFVPDLDETTALAHLAGPLNDPHSILQKATTRLVYDLFAYQRTKNSAQPQPAVVYTLARETHHFDLAPGQQTKVQHSFSYSDGFGREIQKKIQAEPEKINDVPGPPRWVGSGWTIFNNKGKPVRQYEPFFTGTHRFEFGVQVGVSPILFYDPVERVVATLHPNHTYEKVVFDPWRQTTYDVNDTVLNDPATDDDIKGFTAGYFASLPASPPAPVWQTWYQARINGAKGAHEKKAAEKAAAHADTPTTAYFDTLGRPFLTVAHNKVMCPNHDLDGTESKFHTRVELDIEGNQRAVRDAFTTALDAQGKKIEDPLGRIVMRYDYDMLGNRIHQASMEAGERWMLNDVTGKPIRAWDSRGFLRRMTYDALRRPTGLNVTENGVERLAERTVYGEGQGDAANHRTRVYRVFDGAGIVTNVAYDFKGNVRESRRDLLPTYQQAVNWLQNLVANYGSFTTRTTYDALNRPLTVTTPDNSVYRPGYNEANLLEKVDANLRGEQENGQPKWTSFVTNIDYNAKGQRELIVYGNGAKTEYDYDPLTFRLTKLKTTRPAGQNGLSPLFVVPTVVQDLRYTYDPVGNITRIEDAALVTVNNGAPVNNYVYDAIYRLIEAQGREHIGQMAFDVNPPNGNYRDYPFLRLHAHPNDLQGLRSYTEQYEYDAAGNFDKMRHIANSGSWTRRYYYNEDSLIEGIKKTSNRLTRTEIGNGLSITEDYGYADAQGNDVHGCMTSINNMMMAWDFEDQLHVVERGTVKAYYVYDAAGQRVRKVVEKNNGGLIEERIYLGGFEIFRQHDGPIGSNPLKLERETLHIMDDQQRVALVETLTVKGGQPTSSNQRPATRFQLDNHLGSACLELDGNGAVISYEEYHPYGTTSFQARSSAAEVSLKRYRYTGMERDEESGLYYHGARYYAPWLARWASCDPIGIKDGINVFAYVGNRPVTSKDSTGFADEGVTKIAEWLQAFVNSVPEDEWKQLSSTNPEWTLTTPSSRGTRYHTVMEAAVEFGWENKHAADIERVISELHIDASGNLVAVSTPPGAANAYGTKRTADLGVLKEGLSRSDIAARLKAGETIKASDVLEITLDYKTGDAALKAKQGMEALSGVPYERLAKGGDLASDVATALKRVGNPIKAASLMPELPSGKDLAKGVAVTGGAIALLKPVAAAAGPVGDVVEIGMGAKSVADAPPEERARVAYEETGSFMGGAAGAAVGTAGGAAAATGIAALLGLSGPPGWLVLGLGVLGAGAGGYFGSEGGRAGGRAMYESQRTQYHEDQKIEEDRREYLEAWGY